MDDSLRPPASVGHLVAAGVLGTLGGVALGALAGGLIAEPICHASHSPDCGLGIVLATAWIGDLIGVPYAVHRANARRGAWRPVLGVSVATGIVFPIVQIPAVIIAERRTTVDP
jgi:hypothetical protein